MVAKGTQPGPQSPPPTFAQSLQHGCCLLASLRLPLHCLPVPARCRLLPHDASSQSDRLAWDPCSMFDSHRRTPPEARNLPCYSRNPRTSRHPTENMCPQCLPRNKWNCCHCRTHSNFSFQTSESPLSCLVSKPFRLHSSGDGRGQEAVGRLLLSQNQAYVPETEPLPQGGDQ